MPTLEDYLGTLENQKSPFEDAIRKMELPVCPKFSCQGGIRAISFRATSENILTKDSTEVNSYFKQTTAVSQNRLLEGDDILCDTIDHKKIAVLFSGGPAPGGHNVIAGLKTVLGDNHTLYGVENGPKGLLNGTLFEITNDDVMGIINTGGFDFLGTDRTKIKKEEQFQKVIVTCRKFNLDAIVVIGGDDSNTNAAFLAEKLFKNVHDDGRGVQVIGVPKTIDGDLQVGKHLPISFGFDTATKTYSELVSNILKDTMSSRKYWHFVKLMGRAASHVSFEVGLNTRPALTLVSEEIAAKNISLKKLVDNIAQTIIYRGHNGINHGLIIVPEGLIEFIPEMRALFADLNETLAIYRDDIDPLYGSERREFVVSRLTPANAQFMASLPKQIENMLLAERDAHGNIPVSLIPTEELLIELVKRRIKELDPGYHFGNHHHFFGYEGRCGAPTLFDAAFTYNLGLTAGSLILGGHTGYMAAVTDFDKGGKPVAIPLTGLLDIERREGTSEMVIQKALVEIDSPAFRFYEARRDEWAKHDVFNSVGPIQMWGPTSASLPYSVALNQGYSSIDFKIGK